MRVDVPCSIASILLPITFIFPVPYPSNVPLCSFASDGDGEGEEECCGLRSVFTRRGREPGDELLSKHPPSPLPPPLLSFQAFTKKPNPNKQLPWTTEQVFQRGLRHKRAQHKSWFSNEKRKGKGIGRIVTLALESRGGGVITMCKERDMKLHETIPQPTLLQSQPKYIYPDRKRTGGFEKYIYIYIQKARIKLIENEDYAENWS